LSQRLTHHLAQITEVTSPSTKSLTAFYLPASPDQASVSANPRIGPPLV
jgi:hypothetical protein